MAFSIFYGAAGSAWLGTRRADSLVGTDGSDLLLGLAGNDTLNGGDGWDLLIGGAGKDVAEYAGGIDDYGIGQGFFGLGPVTVTALGGAPETGTDTLIGVEALYFAADGYTLHLDGTNNAALAGDDSAETTENALLQISAADLLANDREFDGDTLTIVSVAGLSTGGATVGFDGSTVTYDPGSAFDDLAAGETAQDSFTYVVDDGKGGTDVATVTVTVTGENDAPVLVVPETVSVDEGTLAIDAGISASDVDGETLSYALSGSDAAQFTIDAATGALAFAGAPDFELPRDADGDNSYEITVTVSDGNGGSDSADLGVTVADVDEGLLRISESFETESVGGQYVSAEADGAITALGEAVDLVNNAGQATVDSTSFAGLGYDLSWVNTRGDTGISDGDYIGVQDFTGTVGAYTDGAQGYELQDADGLLRLTFQTVNLSNTGEVTVSLDVFLQETGWEADDLVNIYVETDQGTVALLDSTGQDIDDLGIEGAWMTLETSLGADIDSARLVVELDSNASSESLFIDNVGIFEPVETGDDTAPAEVTLISAVQGSGDASTMEGDEVTVEAVVTYVTSTGFFLQEEDADADGNAATSEGLFIYTGSAPRAAVGDLVQATGTVAEYQGLTELTSVSEVTVLGSGMTAPTAASILLTPDAAPDYEAMEGMSVSVTTGTSEALTITENYNLDRYGQIRVSAGIQTQPTQLFDAQTEAAEVAALAEANANASLLIDDGSSAQNPDSFEFLPGGAGDNGNGYLDAGDDFSLSTIRLGAEITSTVEGVLTYSFDEWTVNASGTVTIDESTNSGARQDTPDDVGGTLQVASYNVLNFFTTLDDGALTGPDGDLDPRGADTAAEFERQADKLVGGILGSGAEVLALQEIENNGSGEGSAIDTLTDLINANDPGANFGYVDPTGSGGFIGTDAITTGIIYDADAVTLLYSDFIAYEESSAAVTNALATAIADAIGYDFEAYDQSNRPSVAATFQDNSSGETFTVVSSHFKSKGDSGLAALASAAEDHLAGGGTAITQADLDALYADANFDQGDGQGFWNGVRTDAAVELAEWIGTGYNGGGVSNVVMLGDMNSYAEEDPVQYLDDDAGFTDLIDAYIGQEEAYSYVFDGQQGTLDQGFADDMLAGFVTGVTEWHINADEPDLLSYDESFVDSAFYDAGVFGSSDHDPLIVGLDFGLGLS
ncbi:VCBS repeat-containing protein [Salipiger thiooxidans]|uniref:VCBS repeat-containing protein n=1 Tax=Salipiger thiooxidans TaxID=282683 RepID=A0A1G7AG39_9RHOB|nr:ExeM/NucH family extracellular endonuclease [Salipiger thiooxidans]SDE13005.1 VCBS repeat-containing protein [Salipiger thiooxidans]